ncbi:cell surface protein [Methanosarcina acetivorans C2A]|uniref:Cell surface protein n=3 Tax=Methanosarcina acetivorans TaxID=2214 RepID=Q8TI64_METAC|nr:cell surface protein [Methanosarcina acetivorans C2A]
MLLLSIAMLAMPAVAIGEATITRTITPSEVSDGDTYNVTLTVSFNIDEDSIAIHEALPADWNLTEVDSGRYIWNTSEEDYTFLDFYGTANLTGVTDTITYSVTVPDGTVSGTYDYGPSYVAGESASEEEFAWTENTIGDNTVTVNGTILNIYSTALENTNPGAPDPGIPGFVGPNGDGKTDCGTVNPIFITWASTVVDYSPANQSITAGFSNPSLALGPVTGDNFNIVSLGDLDQDQINAGELPGSVTLGFDLPIANGEGPDLAVFENGFIATGTEKIFAELAYVEVSTDGIVFARFPSIFLTSGEVGGYGSIDPTDVYNLAGKHVNAYGDSWGTPFDLSTLAQAPEVLNGSVNLNSINYVRIVDIPGSGDFKDSRGNPIYDAWVTWGSGGLDLEAVGVINVGVVSAPVANFTPDVTSGTAPLTVHFNDESTGVIFDYAWDFNNDGIVDSTLQNPSFTYEAPGTYTVSLTVSNTGGSSTETKADYIVAALPDSPVADFSVDVTSGSAPLTVQFTDLTTNGPVSWAWDFESDGIIDSYEQNPSWTYNAAGNYTVTMTATNLVASDTVTRVNLTSVENLPPMADFSADPVATLIGCSVQFTDLSTNSPTSWQWDFNNDGTIDSTMQNPSYTYTTAGTYTVNLTVSNPAGSGDEVKTDYIVVKEQASHASDFTYTSDGSSITITEYTGSDGIVIIPAEIEGLPVTTIGASAFYGCSAPTTVTIPNSVTTIGDSAFQDCSALTTVSIPDSVTTIGDNAFMSCSALTTVNIPDSVTTIGNYAFQDCSALTTVTIGSGVTTIGTSAFQDCSALATVTIGSGVTTIGTSAFQDCSALTTVTIPDSVTTIGDSAFGGCSGLTIVTIGSGVTSIGGVTSSSSFVFSDCPTLIAIDVDTDNSAYASIDGILYSKDATTLIRCPLGKTGPVSVPNSVTTIERVAFSGCTGLTSVAIPDSITSIGDYAFSSCSALTAIDVDTDNSVYASIDGILYNKDITTLIRCPPGKTDPVTIPDSVTTIDVSAFSGCTGLTSVTIPDGVTSIGTYAFYGCSGLATVTIPDSVTTIDASAFRDCTALASVTIGNNVTSIGYYAFRDCSGLTTVTIPDSVTSIPSYAFSGCSGLTAVTIGSGVTSIGENAFSGCSALAAIDVDTDNSVYASIDGILYNKAITTLIQCPSGQTGSVTIPDSVTSIGRLAFLDCSAPIVMVFEGNAPTVATYWNYNCPNIAVYYYEGATGFTTPLWNGVPCYPALVAATGNFSSNIVYGSAPLTVEFTYTGVGANTFAWDFGNDGTVDSTARNPGYTYNVPGTYSVRLNVSNPWGSDSEVKTDYITIVEPVDNFTYISDGTSVTITGYTGPVGDVVIPSTIKGMPVTTISASAFKSNTNITSATTPDSVTSIGDNAFQSCSGLTTVTIGSGVTSIGDSAFYGCNALTSVTIGNNVTTIGTYAFRGCTALTSVTIPDSVTSIGTYAFYGCTYLTSVTIGNNVTSVGSSAFQDCSVLTSVTIPNSVTEIGSHAFRDCTTLTSVIIPDSVTSIGSSVFRDCSALTSVTVGNNVTSIGSSMFRDCTALTSVMFTGNAPDSVSSSWVDGCPDLVVYYYEGATGFTTPMWNGVACYPLAVAPVADFEADVISGIGPMIVNFTDLSTRSPDTWEWDFDNDGTVDSTEQNPSYTYTSAGTYTVNLTVANANGTDSELKTDYIIVSSTPAEPEPIAAFTANIIAGTAPLTVNFTDQSTGSPTAWAWDFDNDGNVDSSEQNPSYTYNAAGNYTVNLTVENAAGMDFELKTDYIEVSEASGSTVTLYFDPESSSVAENESTEINLVASNFPEGFSGYNLTIAIDDPAVAEIVDIEYPTWALITENSSLPWTSIYLKAVDGEDTVKEGGTDVVLATLTVSGKEKGSANLSIGVDRLDDDSGETIEPEFLTGKIEVTLLSPLPDQEYAPKDLNGDGLYEDLTGNGEFSFVDIVAYFHNMDWIEENMPVEYFDFNGNGRIDFDDVVDMFAMI